MQKKKDSNLANLRIDVRCKLCRNRFDFFDVEFRNKFLLAEMDVFECAEIERLFLRGSVIGILEVCNLMRLRADDMKSGFLNVEVVFSVELGVRKCAFIGVFDF